MLYFPHHLPFTVFFWSLCGSNSNINGFSFTTHSDVIVFHLFSVACRPPLRSVIDAGLQNNHKNSENDIKSSWQPTRLQNFGVIIVASLMPISNCFPSPVNFSSLYVSSFPATTTPVQTFIASCPDDHSSIITSVSPFSDLMTYSSP